MRGEVELDINEKSLQMLVSRTHFTVSAGLKCRLTVDIQTLTQSIRSMLCVCLPYPDTAARGSMGNVGQVSLLVVYLFKYKGKHWIKEIQREY